ncbi:putative histone-binding protein lin-53 [Trichinella murrelli]|uniref:Putative histone-binding protein lin-53 n=1 Tax=Trichinella murrelli TaxID=144512 RepID=A0A0V0U8X7_9BILA|nr:putative histone-binding protein lin-53 [Trichinella murrelli]
MKNISPRWFFYIRVLALTLRVSFIRPAVPFTFVFLVTANFDFDSIYSIKVNRSDSAVSSTMPIPAAIRKKLRTESPMISFKIWKHIAPHIYDFCFVANCNACIRSVQCADDVVFLKEDSQECNLIISADSAIGGRLMSATVTIPSVVSPSDSAESSSESRGGYSLTASPNISTDYCLSRSQKVFDSKQMPQKQTLVALQTLDKIELYDTNGFHAVSDMTNTRQADLYFTGLTTKGCGLAWNRLNPGYLLSSDIDGHLCIWDINDGGKLPPLHSITKGKPSGINEVAWSTKNSLQFGAAGYTGGLFIWDIRSLKSDAPVFSFEAHGSSTTSLAFHPTIDCMIASSSINGTFSVWDLRHLKAPFYTLEWLSRAVNKVRWSPFHESILATSCGDKNIYLWNLNAGVKRINDKVAVTAQEEPDELLFIHSGHARRVTDFSWNMESESRPLCVVSVDETGLLNLWEMLRPCSHDNDELCKSYSRFAAISNEKLQWNSKWRCLFSDYKYSLENAWQVKEDVVVLSGTCSKGHKTTYNHSVTTAVFDDVIQDESYFSDLNRVIFDDCISNIHNVKLLQLELKIDFCRVVSCCFQELKKMLKKTNDDAAAVSCDIGCPGLKDTLKSHVKSFILVARTYPYAMQQIDAMHDKGLLKLLVKLFLWSSEPDDRCWLLYVLLKAPLELTSWAPSIVQPIFFDESLDVFQSVEYFLVMLCIVVDATEYVVPAHGESEDNDWEIVKLAEEEAKYAKTVQENTLLAYLKRFDYVNFFNFAISRCKAYEWKEILKLLFCASWLIEDLLRSGMRKAAERSLQDILVEYGNGMRTVYNEIYFYLISSDPTLTDFEFFQKRLDSVALIVFGQLFSVNQSLMMSIALTLPIKHLSARCIQALLMFLYADGRSLLEHDENLTAVDIFYQDENLTSHVLANLCTSVANDALLMLIRISDEFSESSVLSACIKTIFKIMHAEHLTNIDSELAKDALVKILETHKGEVNNFIEIGMSYGDKQCLIIRDVINRLPDLDALELREDIWNFIRLVLMEKTSSSNNVKFELASAILIKVNWQNGYNVEHNMAGRVVTLLVELYRTDQSADIEKLCWKVADRLPFDTFDMNDVCFNQEENITLFEHDIGTVIGVAQKLLNKCQFHAINLCLEKCLSEIVRSNECSDDDSLQSDIEKICDFIVSLLQGKYDNSEQCALFLRTVIWNLVNWSTTTIDNSRVSQAILAIIFALRGLYPLRWNESAKLIIMDGLVLASVFLTGKLNPVEEVYVRLEKESVKLSLVCRIMDWLSDQLGLQESCENLKTRFAQFPWLAFVLIKARQSIAFPNPAEESCESDVERWKQILQEWLLYSTSVEHNHPLRVKALFEFVTIFDNLKNHGCTNLGNRASELHDLYLSSKNLFDKFHPVVSSEVRIDEWSTSAQSIIDKDAEFRAAVKRCFAESVRDARSNLNLGRSLDIVAVKSAVAQDDAWQSVYSDASAPTQLVSLTITDRDRWTATTTAATTVGDLLYDEVLAFVEKNEHLAVERLPEQYSVYFSTLHRAVANLFERYNGFKQSRDDMLKLEKAVVENVRRLYRTTNVQVEAEFNCVGLFNRKCGKSRIETLSTACLDETMRNQLDECWDQMKMHVELFLSQQVSSIITAAGVHLDRLFRNLGNALNSGVSVADEDLFPIVNGIETFCRQKLENFTDTDHYFVNAVFGKLAYNTLFKACLEDHFAVAISYVGVLLDNLEKFTLYKDSLLSWWSFPAISVCEILKLIVKKVTTLTSPPAYDGDDALVEALICILQNLVLLKFDSYIVISEEMWSQLTKVHSVVLVEINQSVLEACCLLAGARQMPDHSRSPLLAVFRDWWLRSALLCFPDKLERVLDAVVVVYDPKCSHPLLLDLANNLLTVAKFSNSKAHPLDSAPLIDDIARVLQCWPFSTVISILLDKSEWLKRHGNCTKRLTMITHYSEMAVAILKLLQLGLYNDGPWTPLPSDPPPGKDFCFELFQFFVRFYNLWWTPEDDSLDQHVQEWLIENEHTVGKLCDLFCECFAKTYISVTTNCRQHYVSMYQEMIFDFLLSVILKKNPYYPFVDVTGRFLCSFDWSQWNLDEQTISKLAETVSNEMYDSLDISQYTALIVQLPWSTFFETFSTDCTDISKRSAVLAKAIWILISCLKPEHHERCRGSYRTLLIRLFQVSSCSLQFQDFADILSQLSSQQSKTICTYDELDCFDSSVSLLQLLSRFSCCQCMLSTVPSVSCSTKWDVFVRFRLKMIYQLHCDQRCKNSLDYNQLRISWIDLLRDVGAVADAFESVHPELGKFLFMLPMKVLVDVLDLQCESLQDVMEKIVEEWSTTANAYSLQCVIFHLLTEHTFNNPALFAFSEICIKSYFTRPFSDATVVSWKRIMSHLPAECQRQWDIVSCYQRKCYYSLYLIMLYQSKRLHDETLTRFVLDVFASMLASGADEQLCTLYLMLCLHLCTDKFQSTSDNSNPGFDFHIKRLYDIISQVNATDRYTVVQWFWNLFQNSSISPKFGLLCELLKCLLKHLNNIHPFGLCASLANDILPQDVLTQLLRERAGRCYTASVQFTLQAITSEQLNLTNIETIFSNIVLTLYNSHCIVDVAYFTDH